MTSCIKKQGGGGGGGGGGGIRLPAGPTGIPVLGSALQWKGPETNLEWTKEYGPIYSVRIGPNQLVYLNSIHLVEEYMERKGAALLGRPEGPACIANGLLFGMGEAWRQNRQAFKRALWDVSLHETYEGLILHEVDHVLRLLSPTLGAPLEIDDFLLPALTHRLVTLLLGEGSAPGRESQEMQGLVSAMNDLENVDLTSKSTQMFLKLRLTYFRRPLETVAGRTIPDMFQMSETMQTLIRGWIDRRRAAMKASGGRPDPRAMLDLILTAQEYVDKNDDNGYDLEMIQSIMDLFNGGVTSSLSALEFAVLFFMHHPDVQRKVKDEVDKVTGSGHALSWANRDRFPYTQATLTEVLRLGSVTPSSLPHVTTEAVTIDDEYNIPKDVFVMAGIYSLHRDPEFYSDPEAFRPERHLTPEGKVQRPRSYRPFGVGERMCLGYHQAEIELFLFVTKLVAEYRVRAEDPSNPPPFDTHMRIVRRLKPFNCVLEPWDT
ncbi:cytochrome P450 2J4-like [Babylonia areolata]|uniref:cytochrome P450 2J4-like n=1 Tax=Babylonia areolata TaxID=304850 RepID=UPI003FCF029D